MLGTVSIIISTRNRADSLRKTLQSIKNLSLSPGVDVELVVVDNGSSDNTSAVIKAFEHDNIALVALTEPTPSKSIALNKAIECATGDVFLFTDDDVAVPPEWIDEMIAPITAGQADAVAGGVRLATSLRPNWMTDEHASMLADTRALETAGGCRLTGANMAIARHVFNRVDGFDPHLGPGLKTTGLHEETLISLQMRQVGFKIATAFDTVVEHRPARDRLYYTAFKDIMEKQGRSDAYVDYHWRHDSGSFVRSSLALMVWLLRLLLLRASHGGESGAGKQGMPLDEMRVRRRIAYHKQLVHYQGVKTVYPTRCGSRRRG